jgi:hypothetical protein
LHPQRTLISEISGLPCAPRRRNRFGCHCFGSLDC